MTEKCDTIPYTRYKSLTKYRRRPQGTRCVSELGADSTEIQRHFYTGFHKSSHPRILSLNADVKHFKPGQKPEGVESSPNLRIP